MKTPQHFGLYYFLMAVVQIIICNFFHLSPYITLTILPVMVMSIPLNVGTVPAMLLAFVTGLAVDMFGEGLLGINTLALVPVAILRKPLIRMVFGEEVIEREETISIRKYGPIKMSIAILVVHTLFLVIYTAADGAGTRPFWFNAARVAASLVPGYVLSLIVSGVLLPDKRK